MVFIVKDCLCEAIFFYFNVIVNVNLISAYNICLLQGFYNILILEDKS